MSRPQFFLMFVLLAVGLSLLTLMWLTNRPPSSIPTNTTNQTPTFAPLPETTQTPSEINNQTLKELDATITEVDKDPLLNDPLTDLE